MTPCLLGILVQLYSITITHTLVPSSVDTPHLHCFGDLTQVHWQWVKNRMNDNITATYNRSPIDVLWTQTPSYSKKQFLVLKSVYFTDDATYQHSDLALDLIHVNSEWNAALQRHFAVWPTHITQDWVHLYPPSILKHSVYKASTNSDDYTITNTTQYIAKPDWIDFPILFYNSKLLSLWGDIRDITSWQKLFEAATTVQTAMRQSGNANFWGHLFSLYQEDITCVLLEFIAAFDGGHIIEEDGVISIDNANATKALKLMAQYFENVTDPNCLTYNQQDILNQFLSGNALFVRGWYSTSLSYMNFYSQGQFINDGVEWNIARLPGYGTLGGVSLAINANAKDPKYFDFAQHTTSFNTSLYKWTQTQIIPPYKEFLDHIDSMTYCNESYASGINKTYFGSNINICALDLSDLIETYLVSRPSYVNTVGESYDKVSDIIQSEITKYLLSGRDATTALRMIKCRLQYLLYVFSEIEIDECGNEIEIDAVLKVLCYSVSILLILICLTLIVLITIHNDHPAILSTSVMFSILLCVGAISMSLAIVFATINPYHNLYSCMMQHIFYNLGFALMFGSMFCSYKRVKEIFKASATCTAVNISDIDVLKTTGCVILGESLCLCFWFMLDSSGTDSVHLHYEMIMVQESDLSFYYQCYLNSLGYLIINIYNSVLVCYGMLLAFQTRYIRYIAFRQSYVYSVIACLFFFTVVIVHPVYFYCVQYQTGHSPNLAVLIYCLSALFLILGTVVLIFSYKLYLLFNFDAEVLREEFLIPRKNTYDTIHSIVEYSKSTKARRDKGNASHHTRTTEIIEENEIDRIDQLSLLSSLDIAGTQTIHTGYNQHLQRYPLNNSAAVSRSGSASDSSSDCTDFVLHHRDIEKLRKLGWIIKPPSPT